MKRHILRRNIMKPPPIIEKDDEFEKADESDILAA